MRKDIYFLKRPAIILTLAAFCLVCGSVWAKSPVTISLDVKALAGGAAVPHDFSGLSFEIEKVLPDRNGKYYFSPDNKPLIAMFKTLGIKSLRVGGNTADRPTIKVPAKADIDTLFAFAKASDIKVIYTLRMREGDPGVAAELAKYIIRSLQARVDLLCHRQRTECFCQGVSGLPRSVEEIYGSDRCAGKRPGREVLRSQRHTGQSTVGRGFCPGFRRHPAASP